VRFVDEETIESKPGCDLILARFVEVLLIEALRTMPSGDAPPRLLHALADPRLAPAIRQMHNHIARSWTVAALAKASASSRSAFFERFTRMVGVPPTDYLLRWRMAVAKRRLRTENAVAEVAECVGYGSASTFSTAFSRHVGQAPGRCARAVVANRRFV